MIKVRALVQVTEDGFNEDGKEHVHAEPGDEGEVIDVPGDGFVMVRWKRTGTASACVTEELEPSDDA